ncbi:MAG: phasin family protein [Alphaproteobacteria bacterium]
MPATEKVKPNYDTFMKSGAQTAIQSYGQAVAVAKEHAEKASATLMQGIDQLASFNQGTVEALVQSSSIVAKGYETLGRAWLGLFQASLESSVGTAKQLFGCKTLREAVDLQNDFAKASFDTLVSETTKISETAVKVTNEALQPLQARANAAVELMLKPKLAA